MAEEPNRSANTPGPSPGDEVCDFCLQTYLLQLEVYCVACDRPVCPICVVHVGGEIHCPECAAEQAEE